MPGSQLKYALGGMRFGKWTAISHVSHGVWVCECDCGSLSNVNGKALRKGQSKSCGCQRVDIGARAKTHGHTVGRTSSKEYQCYSNMLKRCYSQNNPKYKDYGGRGIRVCERWRHSFQNFIDDIGSKPSSSHTIDRIDVDGNYDPSNCRWADAKTQSRNKRSTIMVDFQGKQMPLATACEELGLKYGTVHARIRNYGMTPEEALTRRPKGRPAQGITPESVERAA